MTPLEITHPLCKPEKYECLLMTMGSILNIFFQMKKWNIIVDPNQGFDSEICLCPVGDATGIGCENLLLAYL